MTLEDFFTLTEMKDGLTAPSRVAELLNVMQKEKDSVMKNVGDATRQWAAVASTIAATENKDCLDLFIQLDGLGYIDGWLKDAQNFSNDTSDSFVEESITALLRALEKLQIDNERSISSGIWITVKNLLGHNSSKVQDRARILFDSWKQGEDSDSVLQNVEDKSRRVAEEDGGQSTLDNPITRGSANEENNVLEHAKDKILPLRRLDELQPEKSEDEQVPAHNDQPGSHKKLDHDDAKDGNPDPLASLSNTLKENPSIKEVSPIHAAEGTTSTGACGVPVTKQCTDDVVLSDVLKLNEQSKDEKQVHKFEDSSDKLGMPEISSTSDASESGAACTGDDDASMQKIVREPALQNSVAAGERDVCSKISAVGDVTTPASDSKSGLDDTRVIKHCSGNIFKTTGQGSECCSNALQDLSANGGISGKAEDLDTSFSRMEDTVEADEDKEHTSDDGDDLMKASDFPKAAMDTKNPDVIDKRRFNIEREYGMVDALEVARQVAQEVEREVVDYREPFSSSSSEKTSEGGIRQSGSPGSINGKHELPIDEPQEVPTVPTGQSHSVETNLEGDEGSIINSANLDNGPENSTHDMESSQVTEAAQEPEVNIEKGPCDFDLNQEVSSDETECPANPSTPISLVAASRPAAVPGLPVAPLQFEGSLGWKGSAATSAFRPASPRRNLDGDRMTLSIGGTDDASKQRHDCLDIDLNVAEGGDELGKQIPASSGLPSGESSVEVGSMRSGRLKLDLNCIGDDGDAPILDTIMGEQLFNSRNNHRSPSPALSSSSMQPFLRNIDLNDRPNIHSDTLDHGPSKSYKFVNAYGGPKPDAPVISLMGTRVEVNRKDFPSQTPSLPNGKSTEPTMDASMTRAGGFLGMGPTMSYTHSPVFGNMGLTTGPTMSFSPAIYGAAGSIPYMMDSRGATVVPQIVGSASAVPSAYPQSAFIMSMSGVQPGISNAGQSRPNFDLNTGFMMEGGNRDSGVLRQLFIPGPARSMEEHLRTNLQQPSSSSGNAAKRKEPDSAWEPYPFNYKHQQPPWK
ncbi:uncharacterized protein LOC122317406 [Carya illinoinensis]|uniref:TFIIS N-terminal domain-containing protein n=1 Tax=Carya illinoinensis TaxID=32201 RepID=A0A8T1Q570_CARIL|nr:uncharacterized protein LOC122317406 [Carya illinoinensis]XP_042990426.1 uncharacterized protein LOC122317406 [Carya illinoinensis]XP_042990427.1 uncharacterized protein LOC122317406 [Carya illinoinensis]KAG6648440.1 hypothetical protein CIPAW_07G148100 [Carya illinoinensis]KAG6648441.1 hypothetical protein CIPAW_07G148100 [Carya illinoinensis]KAG6648442.1 hypothetical protein CIPAW_07G148100 [Carya illinoinensis]KAG6648443.1 hypothetical protein CIPAW_07G148100 [Carya illinoinensis]